jgi:signal peptidase II
LVVLFVSLVVVIFDQVTKFLVKGGTIPLLNIHANGMEYGQSINVFGDFFKITFVENPGLAFGIDINETSKLFLSLFSLVASIGILYYIWKSREQKLIVRVALALILGGAVGNLIDRAFYGVFYHYAPIFYGRVVDFFNMDFWDLTIFGRTYERFPIFNIADSAVTVGVALLILFYRNPEEAKEKSEEDKLAEVPNNTETVDTSVTVEPGELQTESSSVSDVENSNRKEI